MQPLLSICIATYNRASFIGETLDSIIRQVPDEVEIVVMDGASTDGTPAVVERYALDCPGLRYVRLPEKGGVDQDFCKAVECARGEYCWLFPDDDLFKPGAIRRVLDELRGGHCLVIVNADVMDREMATLLHPSMLDNRMDETFRSDDLEGLFCRVVPAVSFIGCVVIRRETWLAREHARYFDTEFVHVGVIFQKPLPGTARVIGQPCITIRYGNAHWTSRSFEIWMMKWPRLIGSFEGVSVEARRERVDPEPWRRLRTLSRYRALGSYSRVMYERIVAPGNASRPRKLAALAIALLPKRALNRCMLWYFRTFRKNALMPIYELETSSERMTDQRPADEPGRARSIDTGSGGTLMTVSVALCTYNGARFVREQLESIANQTRLPDELIVCDDGSTDGTLDIVARFATTASFKVRYSRNASRLGVSKNFERAISLCTGDIVFLCDQDDVWLPQKIAAMMRPFLADDEIGLVFSDALVTDSQLNRLGQTAWGTFRLRKRGQRALRGPEALSFLIRRNVVTGATVAFRKTSRAWVLPIPDVWMHDAWIALMAAATGRIEPVDVPLVLYRQHEQNVLGGRRLGALDRLFRARRTEPDSFDSEIAQVSELYRKLESMPGAGVTARHLNEVRDRLRHLSARKAIYPRAFAARLRLVTGELLASRYHRYSRGWSSALADLLLRKRPT
jgi:glycosyltransferase involved in cell wall biosynthesis